jgi:hypothetical protein
MEETQYQDLMCSNGTRDFQKKERRWKMNDLVIWK